MQNYPNLKVDLSNCDLEPIHIIGRIQPHGFMLILDNKTLVVEQASENVSYFIKYDQQALVGHTLAAATTTEEYTVLEKQLKQAKTQNPQLLEIKGKQFFGFMHETEGRLVVECEPYQRNASDHDMLQLTRQYSEFLSGLNAQDSLTAQADLVVDFVQQLLSYDRVMLYRFDEEWNGEVIAEKLKPGVHSYLYHHFPATDIPAQARALLLQKHVRQIPDVQAKAVSIAPYFNPRTGAPANIILSELRNPSEIHLEYLENMEVQATLSISVIVQGKLWGIIACQHQTALFVNFWRREVCKWVAQALANAILAGQEKRDLQLMESYKMQEEELLRQVVATGSIEKGLFENNYTLLSLTGATGAVISINKKLLSVGITPSEQQTTELIDWLTLNNTAQVFHSRQLFLVHPAAAAYTEKASGLLALEISKFNKEYILFFKPEIQETRVWAGRPDKPIADEGKRIHPRQSFEKWTEVVKGKSLPWTVNELEIGQVLLKDVVAYILRSQTASLKNLNTDLSIAADAFKAKNKRLEDFAHIITHNLRSPMSNIRGLYDLYQAEPTIDTASEVIKRINGVVDNMAATIDDLNMIVKSELSNELIRQEVDLQEVVAKELQNLQSEILRTNAAIETELQVTTLFLPKVYIESILHNLLSNAIKYRAPGRVPVIRVKSWQEGAATCLAVSDNGQGMDMPKISSKLFSLYTTFHRNKDAKGLGLYLTKVQTEALGGKIEVYSTPNVGSTFVVHFGNAEPE